MIRKIIFFTVLIFVAVAIIAFSYLSKSNSVKSIDNEVDRELIRSKIEFAEKLTDENKFSKANSIYRSILESQTDPSVTEEIEQKINATGLKAYFQSLDRDNSEFYKVESGDSLTKIAKKFSVTPESIRIINALKNNVIHPGQYLKVMQDDWSILVDKSQNVLTLKAGEEIIKRYPVATGKDNSTPIGDFVIVNRITDPTWYYEGKVEPPGSPENPLGSRWMGFDLDSYGLHGTSKPDEIGEYATLGCVRMHNRAIEELFDLVPVGTKVKIIE